MELTSKQSNAITKAEKWYKANNSQFFTILGYAGTGKTTITQYIIQQLGLKDSVAYVTFTGKASLVLTQKGCPATTIHQLIYEAVKEVKNGVPKTVFRKVDKISSRIKLIVIDEISMVSKELLKDLASYGVPIIALGDPGQLPPIGQNNPLINQSDIFLDEIHRQEASNPIIYLSMLARQNKEIPYGIYSKNVAVIKRSQLRDVTLLNSDQIICGKNKTRQELNYKIRSILYKGKTEELQKNDKLICLKNNWQINLENYPLVNGTIGYIDKVRKYNDKSRIGNIDFRPDFLTKSYTNLYADFSAINGSLSLDTLDRDMNAFDYGYAITCHKSQGSSFNKVVVFEEVLNREAHHKWLYTAITRSEDKLILVK